MATNKKDLFSSNTPALNFISEKRPSTPPPGYKLDRRFVEVKSRRVQLVMQPSLQAKVKAAADKRGLSFNEYVHQILENEMEREK